MARLARLSVPNELHHVLQRGHNAQLVFRDDEDRRAYLQALRDQAQEQRVAVHGYVLLDAEIHLLATPREEGGLGRLMQGLGRRYVAAHNRRHGRGGTLWEGRYRASVVEGERFLLPSLVALAWLPVRLGLVTDPLDWAWSSVHHHLGRTREALIVDHPLYWSLGNTPFDRELAFRRAVESGLPEAQLKPLLAAAERSWALGSERFLKRVAEITDRPLAPRPRGRPRKGTD